MPPFDLTVCRDPMARFFLRGRGGNVITARFRPGAWRDSIAADHGHAYRHGLGTRTATARSARKVDQADGRSGEGVDLFDARESLRMRGNRRPRFVRGERQSGHRGLEPRRRRGGVRRQGRARRRRGAGESLRRRLRRRGVDDAGGTRHRDAARTRAPTLAALAEKALVADGGWVVVEHGRDEQTRAEVGRLVRRDTRRYGDTRVSTFTTRAADEDVDAVS